MKAFLMRYKAFVRMSKLKTNASFELSGLDQNQDLMDLCMNNSLMGSNLDCLTHVD